MSKIILKSCDNFVFEIDESVGLQMQTIANMIEDNCIKGGIKIPVVTGSMLTKVIEYCKKHSVKDQSEKDVKKWDEEFLNNLDKNTFYGLFKAANFLQVNTLIDLSCRKVCEMIEDKTVEEIREILNIKSDYTLEEERKIRRDNLWAFDDY